MSIATILSAIAATQQLALDYFHKTLSQRLVNSPMRAGSWYDYASEEELLEAVKSAEWEPYSHSEIKGAAQGFRARLPGYFGMATLANVPAHAEVKLIDPKGGKADWDGKQKVGPAVSREFFQAPKVEYSTLLIGPLSNTIGFWTVYPGEPIAPSDTDREFDGEDRHNKVITVQEAMDMGFKYAKII